VLDADALNAIAADPMLQAQLQARAGRDQCTVLTPHPLEAARLLASTTAAVQSDRLAAAKELSARFHCTALLKGSGTVIASAGTAPTINPTGDASLAGGGTGDVLAGWLGGLWSQWRDTAVVPAQLAHAVAVAAAYGHGAEAERAGLVTMRAGDLIERLHARRRQGGGRAA
jgi:NAD(P)H-hydrate repair Nnr-like enzyme with NAD(P)H-hydrate dehydratase domain